MSVFQKFQMPQGPADKRQMVIGAVAIALAVAGIIGFGIWSNKQPAPKPKAAEVSQVGTTGQQSDNAWADVQKASDEYRRQKAEFDRKMKQADWEKAHPGQAPPPGSAAPVANQVPVAPVDPEAVKRRDTLHASNIALSFRDGSPAQKPTDMKEDLAQQIATLKKEIGQNITDTEAATSPYPIYRDVAPQPPAPTYRAQEPKSGEPAELTAATGPMYRLFEGTVIDSVLTNQLNGSFAGPVEVMTTDKVWSHDRNHVLIPIGSRIIGDVKQVSTTGQERLAMVFHRLIMPDGYSVDLEKVPGLDQQGATGVKDKVDNHWKSIFGTSVALGLISGFSLYGTQGALTAGGLDQYRQGVSMSVGQSSNRVLESKLNQMPTITIREGHPIKVWISKDLMLPAVENHRVKSDI